MGSINRGRGGGGFRQIASPFILWVVMFFIAKNLWNIRKSTKKVKKSLKILQNDRVSNLMGSNFKDIHETGDKLSAVKENRLCEWRKMIFFHQKIWLCLRTRSQTIEDVRVKWNVPLKNKEKSSKLIKLQRRLILIEKRWKMFINFTNWKEKNGCKMQELLLYFKLQHLKMKDCQQIRSSHNFFTSIY